VRSEARAAREYLDELPSDRRAEVAAVRDLIREAAPEAEETMSWGMLAYRIGASDLVALASQKRHLSLYLLEPCSDPKVLEAHRDRLAGLDLGKGCIRFRRASDLPKDALRDIIAAGAASSTA
jgi:uncharacterized protein YdhG (YjbR/CyaY superfamily)